MAAIILRAEQAGRDLTNVEKAEFEIAKAEGENIASCVHELEGEIDLNFNAAPPAETLAAPPAETLADPARDRVLWIH
jgi:hypothetical protein